MAMKIGDDGRDNLDLIRENLSLPLGEIQLRQFDHYLSILMEWNQRINLTAITNIEEIIIRHFNDSLSCLTVTGDLNGLKLIDIGTGAGFPGIPLKIACPQLSLTLVDSVGRKTRFLDTVVQELKLSSVQVINKRVEILGRSQIFRAKYDWAIARGVASLPVLVEYLLPIVKVGGHMIAMKGNGVEGELLSASEAIKLLGGGSATISEVKLVNSGLENDEKQPDLINHYLVVIEKIGITPESYPRRPGLPSKRPLGK